MPQVAPHKPENDEYDIPKYTHLRSTATTTAAADAQMIKVNYLATLRRNSPTSAMNTGFRLICR